ncbi:MAG: UDP-glucose 4-epimerase GalE [Candidatus Falkowbacteria bacterium]|nr:UDP-glucose 4-epimerase GalE [Candidatus Falkowbacteria bacterium]
MKQAILITGAAGYIGSHVAKHLLANDFKVIVLDNLSRGYREAIEILQKDSDLEFVEGDILDPNVLNDIFKQNKISAVIHCAALCMPDESVAKPFEYYQTNLLGTVNILESMARAKVSNIIFSSTAAVYGEAQELPINETHQTKPISPYGVSKLLAEQAIALYKDLHNINYVIFRFFNVCGASSDGLIGDSKKPSQLLMQNAVRGALGIEPFSYTCPKVDTPDGTPIRDYIDVEDLALAHQSALEYLATNNESQLINLGSGQGFSVKQIITQVERTMGVLLEKNQARPRPAEYSAVYANISKALEIIKWQPKKSLEKSVISLVNWYNKRPRGYRY